MQERNAENWYSYNIKGIQKCMTFDISVAESWDRNECRSGLINDLLDLGIYLVDLFGKHFDETDSVPEFQRFGRHKCSDRAFCSFLELNSFVFAVATFRN